MESRRGFISINMKQQLMQGDGHASVFICQHLATFLYRQNQHSQLELDWDQYRERKRRQKEMKMTAALIFRSIMISA